MIITDELRAVVAALRESVRAENSPAYPLPRNEQNQPYWRFNLALCYLREDWRQWQTRKEMSEVIPVVQAAGA